MAARRMMTSHIRKGIESFSFKGRAYEEDCRVMLKDIGMDTVIVGGANDGGVDLQGQWHIDRAEGLMANIIVQCKLLTRDCPPCFVRELEGTLSRWPGHVGCLISSRAASKACLDAICVSTFPLLFLVFDMKVLERAFANLSLNRTLPDLVIGNHTEGGKAKPSFYFIKRHKNAP